MTDLNRLKVSLTKHNAHKIARLLKEYPAPDIFGRLHEVHAEAAQARKNLSTLPGDALPPVWEKVRALGPDAIDALVLVAIVFSHAELINALANASDRHGFSGRIERGNQLSGKAYTNTVRIIDQLGYATKLEYRGVTFDLKAMFGIPGLGPLAGELIALKLAQAGWNQSNSLADESARLGFHKVFGVTEAEFRSWLASGAQPAAAQSTLSAKDQDFFQDETKTTHGQEFRFRAGHEVRDIEPLARSASPKSKANRLHNEIQNKLYAYLCSELGAGNVGTEVDTGSGTTIDIATQHIDGFTFYEIKTGGSVKASIRQAIPQLLEYAYWPEERRAQKLIIVSPLPITRDAKRYLRFLRKEFKLPISYRQFDLETASFC